MKSNKELAQAIYNIGTKAKEICVASGTHNEAPLFSNENFRNFDLKILMAMFTSDVPVRKNDIIFVSYNIIDLLTKDELHHHHDHIDHDGEHQCRIVIESIKQQWAREGIQILVKMIEAECQQVSV